MSLKREGILELCAKEPDSIVAIIQRQEELIERQTHVIAELTERIVQLETRIAELEGQLNQNSRNSSKPPSGDGFRRPNSPRKKGERAPGGQKGHKGQTLEWIDAPDLIEVHRVDICEGCGESLEQEQPIKVERRQIHDIPPMTISVIEHQTEHKKCPHCGRYNRAKFPQNVQYPIQYGPNLKVLMVYLCVYQLIPYERACEAFADLFGRSISKATVVKAVSECSQNLKGVGERIQELLGEAQILHVDETGMRVDGVRQWLHVASTELLTFYRHHRKRGSRATDDMKILPGFKGTMVHDFWASYFRYPCAHAICNAHILRELKGISENYGQSWCDLMYDLIKEMKKAVDQAKGHDLCSLNEFQIAAFLERYNQIIEVGIRENPQSEYIGHTAKRGPKKQSKAQNLIDRCQKYQDEILSFMRDFSIPFTNNQAERDIRMVKLQQKISGTFRSEEGAIWFCRIRGYISTVKKNNKPVLFSLIKAFEGDPFVPSAAHRQG